MINQHCDNMCCVYLSVGEPQLSEAGMKPHSCLCPLKQSKRGSDCTSVYKRIYVLFLANEIASVSLLVCLYNTGIKSIKFVYIDKFFMTESTTAFGACTMFVQLNNAVHLSTSPLGGRSCGKQMYRPDADIGIQSLSLVRLGVVLVA